MQYHSARYYLPWLGRWGSCDPIGMKGGVNLYGYCYDNPILKIDTTGLEGQQSKTKKNEQLHLSNIEASARKIGQILSGHPGKFDKNELEGLLSFVIRSFNTAGYTPEGTIKSYPDWNSNLRKLVYWLHIDARAPEDGITNIVVGSQRNLYELNPPQYGWAEVLAQERYISIPMNDLREISIAYGTPLEQTGVDESTTHGEEIYIDNSVALEAAYGPAKAGIRGGKKSYSRGERRTNDLTAMRLSVNYKITKRSQSIAHLRLQENISKYETNTNLTYSGGITLDYTISTQISYKVEWNEGRDSVIFFSKKQLDDFLAKQQQLLNEF